MRLDDQLDLATEDLLRFSNDLNRVLRRLRDALPGQPGAASYDAPVVRGHTTVVDDEGLSMPSVSDPTGEAAVEMADGRHPAVRDLRQIGRRIAAIAVHADALVRIGAAWQSRGPTKREREETAEANQPGCELHARAGLHAPAECVASVIDGWMLDRATRVCSACRSRMKKTHRTPSAKEIQLYEERGKWPLMLEASYNMKAS